jgi:hypothetical protein
MVSGDAEVRISGNIQSTMKIGIVMPSEYKRWALK